MLSQNNNLDSCSNRDIGAATIRPVSRTVTSRLSNSNDDDDDDDDDDGDDDDGDGDGDGE